MRVEVFWRVAVVQLAAVAGLAVLLALLLSDGFFENWGWLAGPATWLGCAWITAWVVGLQVRVTLLRAVLAGLLSLGTVLIGLHWLGVLIAILVFAYLCAHDPVVDSLRAQ